MRENCIFCEIVKRSAPASVVYDDEICLAFMDINPINAGHVLVIPKAHFVTLEDCDGVVAKHLMLAMKMLNKAVQTATRCEGILNEIMNGEAAGQEIFHLHIHVVPRNRGDGFGWHFPKGYRENVTPQELLYEIASKIGQHVSQINAL